MTELKSCPLCKGHIAFHGDDECSGCHLLVCMNCRAIFDLSNSVDPGNQCESLNSLKAAIALAWNRRAECDQKFNAMVGLSVSLDVSTSEHDAEHRMFGTIVGWQESETDDQGVILLATLDYDNAAP